MYIHISVWICLLKSKISIWKWISIFRAITFCGYLELYTYIHFTLLLIKNEHINATKHRKNNFFLLSLTIKPCFPSKLTFVSWKITDQCVNTHKLCVLHCLTSRQSSSCACVLVCVVCVRQMEKRCRDRKHFSNCLSRCGIGASKSS